MKIPTLEIEVSGSLKTHVFWEANQPTRPLRFQLRLWSLQQDQWDIVSLAAMPWMSPHWNWFLTPHQNSGWNFMDQLINKRHPGLNTGKNKKNDTASTRWECWIFIVRFLVRFFHGQTAVAEGGNWQFITTCYHHMLLRLFHASWNTPLKILISTKWSKLLIKEILHNLANLGQCITPEIPCYKLPIDLCRISAYQQYQH